MLFGVVLSQIGIVLNTLSQIPSEIMNAATRHIIFTAMLSPAMSTASNPSTAEIPYSTATTCFG